MFNKIQKRITPLGFALCLILVNILAGIDLFAFEGKLTPLAGILVLSPLIASTFLNLQRTILVSIYTIVWSIALGAIANSFGSIQHASVFVPVTSTCFFAIWGASLRQKRIIEQNKTKQEQKRTDFLSKTTGLLNSSVDIELIMPKIVNTAIEEFADICIIFLKEKNQIHYETSHSNTNIIIPSEIKEISEQWTKQKHLKEDIIIQTIKTKKPQITFNQQTEEYLTQQFKQLNYKQKIAYIKNTEKPNTQKKQTQKHETIQNLLFDKQIKTILSAPMIVDGKTLGIFLLASSQHNTLQQEDLHTTKELAERIAASIERTRIFRERDKIAETLQASLLPPALPTIPSLDLAAYYKPLGEGTQVGGDFYDCFEMPDGKWLSVVGDVQGKGVEAAIITSLVHYTLRSLAMQEQSPANILKQLNKVILKQNTGGRFCTLAITILEIEKTQIKGTIALAGHPKPLIRRKNSQIEPIGKYGTLIGALENIEIQDEKFYLEKEDSLLMFSDGLTEAKNKQRELLDETGLAEIYKKLSSTSEENIQKIETELMKWSNQTLTDDIAMLMIKFAEPNIIFEKNFELNKNNIPKIRDEIEFAAKKININLEDLKLIISELATNAIIYGTKNEQAQTKKQTSQKMQKQGHGQIHIRITKLNESSLRLEVTSPGETFIADGENPGNQSIGGRGLMLVQMLSKQWGVLDAGNDSVCVWVEM